MTTLKIQEEVDQIVTLIDLIEVMQSVRLKGFFLETKHWQNLIVQKDFNAVYECIVTLKSRLIRNEDEADIFQMFDKLERDLIKVMIMLEHDLQSRFSLVAISACNRVGRWTDAFEKVVASFHYESKSCDLYEIMEANKNNPFLGSDMVNSIIQLIINSNYRVIQLDHLIEK